MSGTNSTQAIVVGTGAFGTAIAITLADAGVHVRLWGRDPQKVARFAARRENDLHLPGVKLDSKIELTSELASCLRSSDLIFSAVPAQHVRSIFSPLARLIAEGTPVVSLSKGIERGTLERISRVLATLAPQARILALSGPSHAEEIGRRLPTSVVVAAEDVQAAQMVQRCLSTPMFRVYTNTDLIGVELCGATKNVIAIAAGICDGLGLGDNTKAALATRGLAEIVRLGRAMGAQQETFAGLAGIGDLITTCTSRHGRNRALGEALGRGETLASYQSRMVSVAEGATSVEAILELARRAGVEMPISQEVANVMLEGKEARRSLYDLMTRAARSE